MYWPGGVLPIVTPVADKTDIYSFMTFDGGSITVRCNRRTELLMIGMNFYRSIPTTLKLNGPLLEWTLNPVDASETLTDGFIHLQVLSHLPIHQTLVIL